jgi:hypothetical protein
VDNPTQAEAEAEAEEIHTLLKLVQEMVEPVDQEL